MEWGQKDKSQESLTPYGLPGPARRGPERLRA